MGGSAGRQANIRTAFWDLKVLSNLQTTVSRLFTGISGLEGGQRPSCASLCKGMRRRTAGGGDSQASSLPIPLRGFFFSTWSPALCFYGGSETNPILAHGETGAGQQAWLKAADLERPTDQGREKTGPVSGEEKRRGTEDCFSSKGRH